MEGTKRTVGNYEILETLGKGGYSWVKKGLDQKKRRHVALKFMTRADSTWAHEQAEQVRTEIKSLTQIRHENVMKLYAYNLNAKYPDKSGKSIATILLVLEYCPGGELFDILYYTDKLDEKTARTYFRMMIDGIEACHQKGIAHRDIKPQNLLLDRDYQLKLTDFGLSKIREDNVGMSTTYVGTRGYQAPELLAGKKYYNSCDLFSAGVVLFILLTGYPPFDQGDKRDKWYRPLYKNNPEKFWHQHDGCDVKKEAQSLIEGLLCYKANKRMTIEEVKEHPWYKGDVWSKEELKSVLRKRHKDCNEKRKADANKQAEMNHSVKQHRDIPKEYVMFKEVMPEKADRPMFNTLDVVETDPFSAIWRAKEIFEDKLQATCTWSEKDPFEFTAKVTDIGTKNDLGPKPPKDDEPAEDGEEKKEEAAPAAPAPNEYNFLVSVNQDAETEGKQFIQFKRGVCSGKQAHIKFRKVLNTIMPIIMSDEIFKKGWPADDEPAKAAPAAGGVAAGCMSALGMA